MPEPVHISFISILGIREKTDSLPKLITLEHRPPSQCSSPTSSGQWLVQTDHTNSVRHLCNKFSWALNLHAISQAHASSDRRSLKYIVSFVGVVTRRAKSAQKSSDQWSQVFWWPGPTFHTRSHLCLIRNSFRKVLKAERQILHRVGKNAGERFKGDNWFRRIFWHLLVSSHVCIKVRDVTVCYMWTKHINIPCSELVRGQTCRRCANVNGQ